MTNLQPRITRNDAPEGPSAVLHGRWGAAELGERRQWGQLSTQLAQLPPASGLGWDLRGLDWLDHVGAQLLWNHWGRAWPERLQLTDAQRDILQRIEQFSSEEPPAERWSLAEQIDTMGAKVMHAVGHGRDLLTLVGQLVIDLLRLVRNPRLVPWRDVSGHLYRMGATALPITALVGFLIGVVLAYLMSLQLRQFGAESFIVNILGISLIRELGPMLGAILVAGRSGSAITAQIGVMRVTEELDAMRVMGIAHGLRLVLPRAVALGIAMPLIALWTTLAALGGGMLAADIAMGISPAYFVQALPAAVAPANLWMAMAKSAVFGVAIALIGCHWGLRVKPNTQSLGAGTTASVVSSITMVIIVDALFAIGFKNLGI